MNHIFKARIHLNRNLESGATSSFVRQAIDIGEHLRDVKWIVGRGNWIPYAKNKFGISLRTCQVYMRLSKYPIHPKNYKLGIQKLIEKMKENVDLSI